MAGIFKAYDIRGIYGEGLTLQNAYLIGRGLSQELFSGVGAVLVSRDMRVHSQDIARELVHGLTDGGTDVIDIGLASTPMNYWGNVHYSVQGSIQVTASHNGAEYNGFKVSGRGAIPIDFSTGLNRVESFVRKAEAEAPAERRRQGSHREVTDVLTDYLDWMGTFLAPLIVPMKIGIDAANGMGGFFLPGFCNRVPQLTTIPLFWELDGTFPNHEADPLKPENLKDIQDLVQVQNCDIGVAFDGDADRCMFTDENGNSVSSDLITAFIAQDMALQCPGGSFIYDLRSSRIVPEWIEAHGGKPVRGRVGHSFMKRLLREKSARFGGELSGHYYFADCFDTDSGLMALIQVMNIWQRRRAAGERSLSEMLAPLRKYSATGEINFKVADTAKTLEAIETHFAANGARLDHLDGLTVEHDDWWFNLRTSNTEPLLRLNLEADSASARDARFNEVVDLIQDFSKVK